MTNSRSTWAFSSPSDGEEFRRRLQARVAAHYQRETDVQALHHAAPPEVLVRTVDGVTVVRRRRAAGS